MDQHIPGLKVKYVTCAAAESVLPKTEQVEQMQYSTV